MELKTVFLLRIVPKQLTPEKERLGLLYLSICLEHSLNTEVKELDRG